MQLNEMRMRALGEVQQRVAIAAQADPAAAMEAFFAEMQEPQQHADASQPADNPQPAAEAAADLQDVPAPAPMETPEVFAATSKACGCMNIIFTPNLE